MTQTKNLRELLTLAAKALGGVAEFVDDQVLLRQADGKHILWHPHKDDGDAFRLAVMLWVMPHQYTDCFAANRLAILHAAAEIGRRMQ